MEVREHSYSQFRTGMVYALFAWFFFALSYLISKKIHTHTTVSLMVFFRTVIGTVFFFFLVLAQKNRTWKLVKPRLMTIRALSAVAGVALIYLSLQSITLVDATLLQNCAPFFVPIIAFFWIKKPVEHRLWLPMLLGFIGVVVILRPDKQFFHSGAFYALCSGITTAFSMLSIRILAGAENKHTALFYTFAIALIYVTPFALFNWHVDSPMIYLPLLGLGCCAMIGQWLMFVSLQHAGADHMAPFSYAAVVYAGIFDWLFFSSIPTLLSWIGLAMIAAGGLWIMRINKS